MCFQIQVRQAASAPDFSGVVLAAGRSTRMGRDKALLEVDGVPLWRRQRDVLARAGATEIFLSARPEQPWAEGSAREFAGVVYDAFSNAGPLAGITAALERCTHPHMMVCAIDLPRMEQAWFAGLAAGCATGVGAVGRRGEFFEPLAAIYPREAKFIAWEAMVRGEYAVQRFVQTAIAEGLLCEREIGPAEAEFFENWNEPGGGFPTPR